MYAYQCIGLDFSTPVGGIAKDKGELFEKLNYHHLTEKKDGKWELVSEERLKEAELEIYKIGEEVDIKELIKC